MSSSAMIDLSKESSPTDPGRDHFSSLPPELIDQILSFLYRTHIPDRMLFPDRPPMKVKPYPHSFDILAATSHTFRAAVNAWARSFLLKHASIMKYNGKTDRSSKSEMTSTKDLLHGRFGVLSWSDKHCVFCGKKSVRRAILANGLRCCDSCDRKEWPGKITKTQALRDYRLKETDLFTSRMCQSRGPRTAAPGVTYGIYSCQGGLATMFLEESLHCIARRVHGEDWQTKKKKRAANTQQIIVDKYDTVWSETMWTKEGGLQVRPE